MMSEIKPPPGVAISRRRAPGREPVPERLREIMEWINLRQRPPMFDAGPSFNGSQGCVGDSCLPPIRER
jgi:hypothetical protein